MRKRSPTSRWALRASLGRRSGSFSSAMLNDANYSDAKENNTWHWASPVVWIESGALEPSRASPCIRWGPMRWRGLVPKCGGPEVRGSRRPVVEESCRVDPPLPVRGCFLGPHGICTWMREGGRCEGGEREREGG